MHQKHTNTHTHILTYNNTLWQSLKETNVYSTKSSLKFGISVPFKLGQIDVKGILMHLTICTRDYWFY